MMVAFLHFACREAHPKAQPPFHIPNRWWPVWRIRFRAQPMPRSHRRSFIKAIKVSEFDSSVKVQFESLFLDCNFNFEYQFNSTSVFNDDINQALTVRVLIPEQNRQVTVWQSSAVQLKARQWEHVVFELDRIKHDFRLQFDAKPIRSAHGYHTIGYMYWIDCMPF